MVSVKTFFKDEIFEVESLNFELYTMAFAAIESEIDVTLVTDTKVELFQSFAQLSGFDAEEFATGNILILSLGLIFSSTVEVILYHRL